MTTAANPAPDQAVFDDGRVGVYLHLPFCERICPYCDFAVVAARSLSSESEGRYVAGLLRELAARQSDFAGRTLATIYFGGGTPSLFRPGSIARLIAAVRAAFPCPPGGDAVETTIELNPSTAELDRLPGFRAAGINRLSMGIQSFQDDQLKQLGRAHRASVARDAIRAARSAGFANLSFDLIFALPHQSIQALDRDLDELILHRPEHVSTYELTFEPETPFGRAVASGRMRHCDEDLAARMIEHVEVRLSSAGYSRYEISSYSRSGLRARHNARYWQRQAVLGLGMGAHSFDARTTRHPHGYRRANSRSLEAWLGAVAADAARAGECEALPAEIARGEAVFLALRQRDGLSADCFEAEFGHLPRYYFEAEIDAALARGWLEEWGQGNLRLTRAGRLLADSVAALFVAESGD